MRTRPAILSITLLSVLLIGLFFFAFKKATDSKNKVLLQNRYAELKKSSFILIENNNKFIENFILDNTYDYDLQRAVVNRDSTYINNVYLPSLSSYDIDYFWAIDDEMNLITGKDGANKENIPLFEITKKLSASLDTNPYINFYTKFNDIITQIVIAPVDLSGVSKKADLKKAYFVCGKRIDSVYLKSLGEISNGVNFNITESTVTEQDSINSITNTICFHYKLPDLEDSTIATLESEKTLDEIKIYANYLSSYSFILLGVILLLLFGYYQYLSKKVLRPIDTLSKALNEKDESYLSNIKFKKDEFADMARLIDTFFKNNKKLKEEIKLRLQSENELKVAAENLEHATVEKIRAEQDRLAKGDFLSTMSHEIRTPINGVIGIANLLKSENLNPNQQELVDTLLFSSNYLLSILTDILDFSKIESGNLTFDKVQFNIKEICKSVQSLYSGNAKNKGLALDFTADENAADYLSGDSTRLCQMLNNLVGNAIKFTAAGRVQIQYRLLAEKNNQQTIEFSVTDTGIGIAEDKLDTIFDSFAQADSSISTNYGGTGLGLAITKKLIELQGGTISVISKINKGTTFTFTLTFDKVDLAQYEVKKSEKKKLQIGGLRVLVAEDNKINATILNKFLDKWQVKMDWAVNGKEALEKLEENTYDLVLMDLHMPVMGGKEATAAIRDNLQKPYCNIPIIALTADATTETKKFILAAGFNEYVTKPFDPEKLYETLEKYSTDLAV